ncbi:MAG: guanylate kinase [Gemmatimonadetes bacterium]|nr:guanylate kinase [Gemmatimonadota bacterium]HCK11915.1 guanylate kinase [Candidatus Latescibacterota bacterium]
MDNALAEELFDGRPEAFALVVSGPSGVGKSSIRKQLVEREPGVHRTVTTTTRTPRAGEVSGRDYHFISDDAFSNLTTSGELLEHAFVHGSLYGTTRAAFKESLDQGDVVLLEVDVQAAQQWRRDLGNRCVTAFILPPSVDALRNRLSGRQSEDEDALKVRMQNAIEEMAFAPTFNYAIVNIELEEAIQDIQALLRAERTKATRKPSLLEDLGVK